MKTIVYLFAAALGGLVVFQQTALLYSGPAQSTITSVETGKTAGQAPEKPKGPPPLVVDKDAPLLLDEPAEADQTTLTGTAPVNADNAACYVCHANFKGESLAQAHAQVKMGCIDCHGKSFAHRNDENNTTPPEKMYPLAEIDRACQSCHPSHDVPAIKVVALARQRGLTKADSKAIVCTECHGDHRLAQRTVRWDKKTGKLLPRTE